MVERDSAIFGHHHRIEQVRTLESQERQVGVVFVVFHQQNASLRHVHASLSGKTTWNVAPTPASPSALTLPP